MSEKIEFTPEQSQRIYGFLMRILQGGFLYSAENDSSTAYWLIESYVDGMIEELFMEWRKPLYKLHYHNMNPKSQWWGIHRITDDRAEFNSKDEQEARAKLDELNKPFIDSDYFAETIDTEDEE